jgi:hypothetical protein
MQPEGAGDGPGAHDDVRASVGVSAGVGAGAGAGASLRGRRAVKPSTRGGAAVDTVSASTSASAAAAAAQRIPDAVLEVDLEEAAAAAAAAAADVDVETEADTDSVVKAPTSTATSPRLPRGAAIPKKTFTRPDVLSSSATSSETVPASPTAHLSLSHPQHLNLMSILHPQNQDFPELSGFSRFPVFPPVKLSIRPDSATRSSSQPLVLSVHIGDKTFDVTNSSYSHPLHLHQQSIKNTTTITNASPTSSNPPLTSYTSLTHDASRHIIPVTSNTFTSTKTIPTNTIPSTNTGATVFVNTSLQRPAPAPAPAPSPGQSIDALVGTLMVR